MMHTDLLVFQKSQELVQLTYIFISKIPRQEFDLISQIKKAVISIPLNIAEGAGRNSREQLLYFLNVALGSLSELEAQYQVCINTGISQSDPELYDKIDHVKRLIINLIKSLNKKPDNRITV